MSTHHKDADVNRLANIARRAMFERGLEPDFPPAAQRQAEKIAGPAEETDPSIKDLRDLEWASIDNDDSRDLDQLSVAEALDKGAVRVLVAIADVDALVPRGTPLDAHALINTTSVYTPGSIFPMLPERLSTDLTSLNPDEDRLAMVVSFVVNKDGSLGDTDIYRAYVRNKAKLAYHSVGDWLESQGPMPEAMAAVKGIAEQIRLQDGAAQLLLEQRRKQGALTLETVEPKAVVEDGKVVDLHTEPKNRAHDLIENFMITANGVVARYLTGKGFPTLRRVVRSPERWDRIRDLASEYGVTLPPEAKPLPLENFLAARKKADPLRFPDLSLAVVKLMGPGEYIVNMPGKQPIGHFGLAVRDYSHSTAPNRRYPDIITQRLLKAAIEGRPVPYAEKDLWQMADHCTEQENAAKKVERQVRKSAAASILADRIGERFDALVTGAGPKGTWVRLLHPPVEGRLTEGFKGVDVGDKIRVRLEDVDINRGFIDFSRSHN
jgi:VacB/RNase II family 3'-5' exoribonuclease